MQGGAGLSSPVEPRGQVPRNLAGTALFVEGCALAVPPATWLSPAAGFVGLRLDLRHLRQNTSKRHI